MIEIEEYLDADGNSPFGKWFGKLKAQAAAKVTAYLARVEDGNFSSFKGIGQGVHECRIDWGSGYRVYAGKDGAKLVILLGGGTKKRQQADIKRAKAAWQDYKKRKKDK